MTSSASPAPFEELASLRARVQQFESQMVERDVLLEERAATIEQHEATIERLQEQVRLLLARRFGASSEKLPDAQLGLFNEAEASAAEEPEADAGTEVAAHRRARPVRAPLPESLERVDIEHELAQSERTCPHHGVELERFGEVVSEQLDIVPAKVRVLRHIRGKYRCPCCEGHLRTAALAAQPLPKSFASPGLLAFIVTAKYVDGLPLYRQQQQFGRLGVELSRTTLARWVVGMGELVVPLMNLLHEELLGRAYVLMDETTVQVLKEPGKAPETKSQLWAMMSPGPEPPIVVFAYDPTRAGDVPRRLLAGFSGALHTDGYSGYGPAVREYDLVHLACWRYVADVTMLRRGGVPVPDRRTGRSSATYSSDFPPFAMVLSPTTRRHDHVRGTLHPSRSHSEALRHAAIGGAAALSRALRPGGRPTGHVARDRSSSGQSGSSTGLTRSRTCLRDSGRGCDRAVVAARRASFQAAGAPGCTPEIFRLHGAVAPFPGLARGAPHKATRSCRRGRALRSADAR